MDLTQEEIDAIELLHRAEKRTGKILLEVKYIQTSNLGKKLIEIELNNNQNLIPERQLAILALCSNTPIPTYTLKQELSDYQCSEKDLYLDIKNLSAMGYIIYD